MVMRGKVTAKKSLSPWFETLMEPSSENVMKEELKNVCFGG